MRTLAIPLAVAAMLGGCTGNAPSDGEPATSKPGASRAVSSEPVAVAPQTLKKEARELVSRFIVRDLKGTSASVHCGWVYEAYVSCSATWKADGNASCQGDFDLDRSNRPLTIPPATTSYCIQVASGKG
jgi:hypothetical protein